MEALLKQCKKYKGKEFTEHILRLSRHTEQFSSIITKRDFAEYIIVHEPMQFEAVEAIARELNLTMIPNTLNRAMVFISFVLESRIKEHNKLIFCEYLLDELIEFFGEKFVIHKILETEFYLMGDHVKYLMKHYPTLTFEIASILKKDKIISYIQTIE